MKKLALAAALLVPVAASANIYSTKHNFAANTAAQSTDREICKYCHVPHKNVEFQLVWNHTLAANTYSWSAALVDGSGNPITRDGTRLPTAVGESKRCLSCHDGTVALGNVKNVGGGQTGAPLQFTGTSVTAGGMMQGYAQLGIAQDLSLDNSGSGGNHPIGIGYAGQGEYLGQTSAASVGEGGYWPATAGFTDPAAVGGAVPLKLHRDYDGVGYGVECGTCHDPHGKPGIPYLLRVTLVESALCRSCHAK